MFGHHRRAREREKLGKERSAFEQQKKDYEAGSPAREKEAADFRKSQIAERSKEAQQERNQAYQQGRARSEELFNRNVQGLTPEKRNALQYEANRDISRNQQAAQRRLLGEQSRRGIRGKGGVGFAQELELERLGNEARGGVQRDLDKLNSDLALKKLAAMFNVEQGEAAQSQLDRQLAADELDLMEERKKQRNYEDQFNRLFSRI
jgi:hypothetical protein